jgi:formyltetrahydrofolate synthetase
MKASVEIVDGGGGFGTVKVDGGDISMATQECVLICRPGEATQLHLKINPSVVNVNTAGTKIVVGDSECSEAFAKALYESLKKRFDNHDAIGEGA